MEDKAGKIRVLQLNKLYYPAIGGIERVVWQVAEGLSNKTEMKVLTCSDSFRYKKECISNVEVIRMPKLFQLGSLPVPLGYCFMLRQLAKELDIIHLHMPFPIGDLACLLSGYKGKIVLWWHSDVVRQKKMMHIYKPIMLRMLQRADVIVVATEGHIEGSAYLKPFREKCMIIPFGVEKKIEEKADLYLEKAEKDVDKERKDRTRFLFVGRLVYYKGCDVLLEAFSKVEGAELFIVGSGKQEPELRQFVNEKKLSDKVTFLGEVSEEELYRQYEACDVFVLPSVARSEAFGLVQIEAMAFGKPVINTNLPSGVPYVSLHKETGLTVEPGNAEELAAAMQWLVDHEKERLLMGEKARERMKKEYRLEDMIARVFELYRNLTTE